ncbi:MAG: trypsin-like peptidase domain-containing protein [Candidatus Cloacimonadota bacterium]|nr:trypsin-like peptidase domain-containing protein [Candidatus Cloacimonadota bacterium]
MSRNNVLIIILLVLVAVFLYQNYKQPASNELPQELQEEILEDTPKASKDTLLHNKEKQQEMQALDANRHTAITRAVTKIEPAVVSVNVTKTRYVRRRLSFFFGFYDEIPQNIKSLGSGILFSKEGYILTNAHVVDGATEIKTILSDNRQFDAELIGTDNLHDIAVLKIEGEDLPVAKLGDSDDLIIGEWVIAVGNPYGFLIKGSKPSVSVGVVSAVNRDFAQDRNGKVYRRMIQTDAAINQGNSGGPLVNIYGEVIGINTFILSESGGNIGIGFAIPINRAKKMSRELIQFGEVRQIWFNFTVQDLNPSLANYYGLDTEDGIMVTFIDKNSPAAKAGLQEKDIIIKINNTPIKDIESARLVVADITVGEKIYLEVLRDGRKIKITVDAVEYK